MVYQSGHDRVAEILKKNEGPILHDVLGKACHYGELSGYTAQWDINGEKTGLGVKVVSC